MAINVPTYREQTVNQSPVSGQKQNIDAPAAAFGGATADALVQAGTAISRLGDQWNRKAINLSEENNELYALQEKTAIDTQANDMLYNPETGLLTQKGRNALGAPKQTDAFFNEIQKKYDARTDLNPSVRQMINKQLIEQRARYGDVARRYQLQEYTSYKNDTLNSSMKSNLNDITLNYMDDKNFQQKADENFKLLQSRATSEGWDDSKLEYEKKVAYAQMRGAQIEAMMSSGDPQKIVIAQRVYNEARNRGQMEDFETASKVEAMLQKAVPKAAADVAFQGGRSAVSGDRDVINFVIDKQEGGDKVIYDTGGETKFGISKKTFKDVDVKNLTREQAIDIYKKDYWNAYKIGDLPDNMQLIAFDTVVNHSSPFSEKVVKAIQSGAGTDEILNMRLHEYQRLAQNEKYAPSYNGWVNRLKSLKEQQGAWDANSVYATAAELEKKYKGSGQEFIKLYETDRDNKAAVKKANHDDVQTKIQDIVYQNNGDYTKVPVELRSQAASMGIDYTKYKGVSNPEMVNQIDAMTSDELFNLDLNDPAIAQELSFDKRQEIEAKQKELAKPENKFMADTIDDVVGYYFQAQKGDPTSKSNKQSVAEMKNYVAFSVQKMRDGGKVPTKADVTKIAAEYLNLRKDAGLGTVGIKAIPDDRRLQIENYLLQTGEEPTNAKVAQIYLEWVQTKKIDETEVKQTPPSTGRNVWQILTQN